MGLSDFWSVLVFLLRLYGLVIAPVLFAFPERLDGKRVYHVEIAMCLTLYINLIVRSRKGWPNKSLFQRFVMFFDILILDMLASANWNRLSRLLQVVVPDGVVGLFLWFRMYHLYHLAICMGAIERRIPIRRARIWIAIRVLFLELFASHVVGCIFYYLAASEADPANSWLGSLTLGTTSYSNFKEMSFWKVYMTCTYFAGATLTTVGYGDIHPENWREMLFATSLFVANVGFVGYVSGALGVVFSPPPNECFCPNCCPRCRATRSRQ